MFKRINKLLYFYNLKLYLFINRKNTKLNNNCTIDILELKKLINKYNKNKTYLDYVLEMIKNKKIEYNLTNVSFYGCDINDRVKFYIIIAKHDMMKYIKDLTEDDLLREYNGKTLLEELLNVDAYLTINSILSKKVKAKIKIATILKSKGFVIEDVDTPLKDLNVTSDYLKKQQMRYGIGPLYEKGDYLLNKLQNLFLNDGKSDKDLVMSLVCGYRQALITNYDVFIKELELLIRIKELYPKMYYIKTNEDSFFRSITGSVYSDEFSINTVLHETGHVFHLYICDGKYPNNLEKILEKVRNNKDIIKKIAKFSEEYNIAKEKLCELVELKYNDYSNKYYTKAKIIEIEEFLNKIKEEKKNEYINLGIDEKKLDSILDEILNKEEYIKTQKRHFINEFFDTIKREKYGTMIAIFDIIDGIFEGNFYSENLFNENKELIKKTSGHGIPYYSCDLEIIFCEMIANFLVISKCYNADKMLKLLKDTIGDELYNLISNYYYNNILGLENGKSYKKNK